jgi:hypothetical protein
LRNGWQHVMKSLGLRNTTGLVVCFPVFDIHFSVILANMLTVHFVHLPG